MLSNPVVRNYAGNGEARRSVAVTPVSLMLNICSLKLKMIAMLAIFSCIAPHPVLAAPQPTLAGSVEDNFSARYTELTKKILLSGIELERFSLNYRLHNKPPSTARKLLFLSTQEAGAATGLAFEISAVQQFGRGRRKLVRVNKHTLQHGLRTAQTGSIVAAAGSGIELAGNAIKCVVNKRRGFDFHSANRFVAARLQSIDALLAQREALVAAHPAHPAYQRALVEGRILHAMRGAFVDEYAQFSANSRSSAGVQNLFYALNMSYNILGAVGAGLGYNAVNQPRLNGPSNIVFTVSGAMAAGAPILCSAQLWLHRKLLLKAQRKRWDEGEGAAGDIGKQAQQLTATSGEEGSLIPSMPATVRLAMYTDTSQRFVKQLESEITTMQRLNKVALQSSIMGPAIGGLLMAQGILGTRGYYEYFPGEPKTQLDLGYKGAVLGTVGTTMALAGNVAWLLASLSYEHRLKRDKKLPEQLIKERLAHLDDVERIVSAL